MRKHFIPLVALAGVLLTSCGGGNAWTWEKASADGELNYCLLIGQIDHNDSAARTAGIRDHLHTRGEKTANANTEKAVAGELKIGDKTYKVNELESGEQKNIAGATWDQQTATSTAETWLNKHGDKIDFFVSNNDGMAEGAIGASNWLEGLPIFGYDSNASTLQYIKEGKIMGTVNQNAPAQAAGIFMLTRNAMDYESHEDIVSNGFTKESSNGYGQIGSKFTYKETDHSFLVDNFAITSENIDTYLGKGTAELVDKGVKKGTTDKKKVLMSYYNNNDTFLNSNMKPLFKAYLPSFNFDLKTIAGDGNDEASCMNQLEAAGAQDAYIINMVKTANTALYLDKIAGQVGATAEAPTDVPVIFWNRQGTKQDGTVDQEVMKDARFKHIYYVGFDAIQGGQIQGQMIVDYFAKLAK